MAIVHAVSANAGKLCWWLCRIDSWRHEGCAYRPHFPAWPARTATADLSSRRFRLALWPSCGKRFGTAGGMGICWRLYHAGGVVDTDAHGDRYGADHGDVHGGCFAE